MTGRLFALSALATVLAACGGEAELAPQQYPGTAEQLVTRAEVGHQTEGSPEHELMSWWRSSQYADRTGFLRGFARVIAEQMVGDEDIDAELEYFAGGLRVAKPEVTEVDLDGDRATVYTVVRFHQPIGSTRFVTNTKPQAFPMVRQRNGWRLADDHFFRSIIAPLHETTSSS